MWKSWRLCPIPADWGVTPATARLLTIGGLIISEGVRPFFCQVEAVETMIWLTEVAPKLKTQYRNIRAHLESANAASQPRTLSPRA